MADTIAIIGTQLVTMLGLLYYLGQRIDGQGRELRSEIRAVRAELQSQLRDEIGGLRAEVAAMRAELSARLDAHIERHAT